MIGFPDARRLVRITVVGSALWVAMASAQSAGFGAWQRHQQQAAAALAALAEAPSAPSEAGPDAVELTLSFEAFFRPVGERGLEFSDELLGLHGRRVRLTGYLLREPERTAGLAVLLPRPLWIEAGSGERADLPPTAVHLHLPAAQADRVVPYRPGRITLVGSLAVGPVVESDLRTSVVRLLLDEAEAVGLTGNSVP